MLIGYKQLLKGLKSIGSLPWLLDTGNMARFCNRGADTPRGTKFLDEVAVVGRSMLTWQVEAIRPDTRCSKNLTVLMELGKSYVKLLQGVSGYISTTYDVTNIKKCTDTLYHLCQDMAHNHGKIHLLRIIH